MVTLLTGLAAVTCFALGSCLAARMTRPSDRTDGVLTGAVIFSGAVFLSAEGLSAVRLLAAVGAWALMGLLFLGATLAAALLHRPMREIVFRPVRIPGRDSLLRVGERGPAEKRLLLLMGTVLSVGVVVNLALAVAAEPCTPDVLDYHLARVAYWLQNGSTGYFVSPQAPHNAYPKFATVLQCLVVVIADRTARYAQLVQLAAYGLSMVAVRGITLRLGVGRREALFAAFGFGLLTICLMEAATAQNDLAVGLFTGISLYALLGYRDGGRFRDLALSAAAFAMALGTKITALFAIPGLLLVVAVSAAGNGGSRLSGRRATGGVAVLALSLALFTLPSGYLDNLRRYGHPLGPAGVVGNPSQQLSPVAFGRVGVVNLLRYGVQFLSLDGFPPFGAVERADRALRAGPRAALDRLGIDLTAADGVRGVFSFEYDTTTLPDATRSHWGILGFALVWPAVVWAAFRGGSPMVRALAGGALAYFVVQSLVTYYDPFHGRYFITAAFFALPVTAAVLQRVGSGPLRAWAAIVLTAGCLSALGAVFFRNGTDVIPRRLFTGERKPSVFSLDRAGQMSREMPDLYTLITTVERVVPEKATIIQDYELANLLFFGEKLTRRIIPLREYGGQPLRIEERADFLVYKGRSYPGRPTDLLLRKKEIFGTVYLRDLRGEGAEPSP
jgi:hypothetical protein